MQSNGPLVATETPVLPPGRRWTVATREFFAYHGVWAFGVRAMRLWSLRMKMVLLVTVMALPLLPLLAHQIAQANREVLRSSHRLSGLAVAEAAYRLAVLLDGPRQALETGQAPPDQPELASALALLDERVERAQVEGLALGAAWRSQRLAVAQAMAPGAVAPATRLQALGRARQALVGLRAQAVSESQLLLSEDPGHAARAALAVQQLPALHRHLAGLRGLATRQAALLTQIPLPEGELHALQLQAAGERELLAAALHLAELQLVQGLGAAGVAVDAQPLKAVRSFMAHVDATVLAYPVVADAPALRNEVRQAVAQITGLQRTAEARLQRELKQAQADARTQRRWMFGALTLTGVLAVYLVYSFFLVMHGGLAKLNNQMTRMAKGDLSARPQALGGDEVAETLQAMTQSLARLSDLLASVRQGVGAITQAAEQIALGNGDLRSRSRRSAEGLDSVVAAVRRSTEQLQRCAATVEQVVGTVQELRLASVRNRRHMQRLQERMQTLRASSREIGQIVNLIDGIAFRTNILALNAQVEASKAGDAGRGFTVVAQEVRALATRSAASARQVGEIVQRSTVDIEQGAALAEETARAIAEADAHVDGIHGAMSEVATLTRRGDQDAVEILDEIRQLQDGTAKNLDLVDQLAVASDALRAQGERLSHKVRLFKLS